MVRHGQSTNNVVRDNPGAARTSDPDLTDLGHQQAEALGTWMAANGPRPGRIFCSLMRRTIQTAHPWADALDVGIEARADLHENAGPYLGDHADKQPHPGSARSVVQGFSDRVVLPDSATEQGWWSGPTERLADSLRRAQRVAQWLWTLDDDIVGLVIHGAFGSMLLSALLQPGAIRATLERDNPSSYDIGFWYRLDNASVTLLELDRVSGEITVDWINRIDHLSDPAV